LEIINLRRSVRSFKDIPVEDEKIEKLLRAAMQAPSANNQQPWYFLVIKNKAKLKELDVVSRVVPNAQVAILLLNRKENLLSPGRVSSDMAAATQNILLEATYLELGSCWIGLYNDGEDKFGKVANCRKICNIPDEYDLYSMVAIGYPEDEDANKFINRYDPTRVFYGKI